MEFCNLTNETTVFCYIFTVTSDTRRMCSIITKQVVSMHCHCCRYGFCIACGDRDLLRVIYRKYMRTYKLTKTIIMVDYLTFVRLNDLFGSLFSDLSIIIVW